MTAAARFSLRLNNDLRVAEFAESRSRVVTLPFVAAVLKSIDVFGDRAYVEVMGNLPDQQAALRPQRKLAKHFGRPTVAVNDVHYVVQSDGYENGSHHTLVQARKFKSSATGKVPKSSPGGKFSTSWR